MYIMASPIVIAQNRRMGRGDDDYSRTGSPCAVFRLFFSFLPFLFSLLDFRFLSRVSPQHCSSSLARGSVVGVGIGLVALDFLGGSSFCFGSTMLLWQELLLLLLLWLLLWMKSLFPKTAAMSAGDMRANLLSRIFRRPALHRFCANVKVGNVEDDIVVASSLSFVFLLLDLFFSDFLEERLLLLLLLLPLLLPPCVSWSCFNTALKVPVDSEFPPSVMTVAPNPKDSFRFNARRAVVVVLVDRFPIPVPCVHPIFCNNMDPLLF